MTARRTIVIACIVAKALTNVTWYAHAARATIRVGLRGLTERVAAVGFRLVVSIPPGHGSRVRAHLPCT